MIEHRVALFSDRIVGVAKIELPMRWNTPRTSNIEIFSATSGKLHGAVVIECELKRSKSSSKAKSNVSAFSKQRRIRKENALTTESVRKNDNAENVQTRTRGATVPCHSASRPPLKALAVAAPRASFFSYAGDEKVNEDK